MSDECGKGFGQLGGLKRQTHVEKPHGCGQCRRAFTPEELNTHHQTHSEQNMPKPFVCGQCGRGFKCTSYYTRHCHIHTKDEIFPCDQCDKVYYKPNSFKYNYPRETVTGQTILRPDPFEEPGNAAPQSPDVRHLD